MCHKNLNIDLILAGYNKQKYPGGHMSKVAVTYSPVVGGDCVISIQESFQEVGSEVINADYRQMMADIPEEEFKKLYDTLEGRKQLFAHAKAKAIELLNDVDCLAVSGNSAMIDPSLFNTGREEGQKYDFSRTIAELALVHVATQNGMPIFGICGGHQVVAVYGGGEISDLNADQLEKQRYMNYDAIKINKNTMLAQIFAGEKPIMPSEDDNTKDIEREVFGAHFQVVSKLGKGFKQTATAIDNESIEAAENEFGAPILTTQFHLEVGAKGLPNLKFIYLRTEHEMKSSLRIFDYVNKSGDAYRQKKSVMDELKSFKPTDENQLVKPSDVKMQQKPKGSTAPHPKASSFWKAALVIGTILAAALFLIFPPVAMVAATGILVGVLVRIPLSMLLRKIISDYHTNPQVKVTREKEASANNVKIDSSYAAVLREIASPEELIRDTEATLWKKQVDEFVDNGGHKINQARETEVDQTVTDENIKVDNQPSY